MMTHLRVENPGLLTTVQDLGRRGHASIGVGVSGAADRESHLRANRLVGNLATAATLEVTLGGVILTASAGVDIAVTGAETDVLVDGIRHPTNTLLHVRKGQQVSVEFPRAGLRNYLAIRGGFDLPPVLGSRSTDTLAKLGPDPLVAGAELPVGCAYGPYPPIDFAPTRTTLTHGPVILTYTRGPRDDWFTPAAHHALSSARWNVSPSSNRIGVRLNGPHLTRAISGELLSEGAVTGSIQVPPSGPIVFLEDHPVTGGYPVIGVVDRPSLDRLAQTRAGQTVLFQPHPPEKAPHAPAGVTRRTF